MKKEESDSAEECECEKESFSRWDLLRSEQFFNKTVTADMVEELKESWNVIGKPISLFMDFKFLNYF